MFAHEIRQVGSAKKIDEMPECEGLGVRSNEIYPIK